MVNIIAFYFCFFPQNIQKIKLENVLLINFSFHFSKYKSI